MRETTEAGKASPFVCVMDAIEPGRRGQHVANTARLFHAVESVRELPDGYAFRLPGEAEVLVMAAEFIALERLCCPFFGFALEVEPEGGPVWLKLTGPAGVKQFVAAEVGNLLGEAVVGLGR